MSQFRSIALAALLGIGAAGHLANAASPIPAQPKKYAQVNGMGGKLSLGRAQDSAAKSQDINLWAVTSPSGVHIPSHAGFVGYH